jgi:hypothetical protein
MLFKRKKIQELDKTFDNFREVAEGTPDKEKQLDQFIVLLEKEQFSSEDALEFKNRPIDEKLRPYREMDQQKNDRNSTLDSFILLLERENITSEEVYLYQRRLRMFKLAGICLGFFLAALGALAILLPLPKSLEIMTIFYFNPDDGITVSDLLGAFVMVTGIYVVVNLSLKR